VLLEYNERKFRELEKTEK